MKNAIRLMTAAMLAAVMSLFTMGSAHAYPDPVITITAPEEVVGGEDFDVSATSSVPCDVFFLVFADSGFDGSGTEISGTFSTNPVTAPVETDLGAVCEYAGDDEPEVEAADLASARVTIRIVPAAGTGGSGGGSAAGNGVLPNTGSNASLWMLVATGTLVVAGGGAVLMNRRESDV